MVTNHFVWLMIFSWSVALHICWDAWMNLFSAPMLSLSFSQTHTHTRIHIVPVFIRSAASHRFFGMHCITIIICETLCIRISYFSSKSYVNCSESMAKLVGRMRMLQNYNRFLCFMYDELYAHCSAKMPVVLRLNESLLPALFRIFHRFARELHIFFCTFFSLWNKSSCIECRERHCNADIHFRIQIIESNPMETFLAWLIYNKRKHGFDSRTTTYQSQWNAYPWNIYTISAKQLFSVRMKENGFYENKNDRFFIAQIDFFFSFIENIIFQAHQAKYCEIFILIYFYSKLHEQIYL